MENRTYGYVRISDKNQNEARQVEALLEFGVKNRNIKIDKISGKDFNRKAYKSLIGTEESEAELREGDLLVILSIDRLGRNYEEIKEQWRYITQVIKADIKVLDMSLLDTRQQGDSLDNRFIADLVMQILSYVAQKERENIKKRQAQGIAVAKAQGKHLGRPQAEYPEQWQEIYTTWKAKQITAVTAFQQLGLTKNTFYNLVKRYENE
jgi:DNA invertase Pin-like site-specific DNA recombinase